ncbi:MAG: DUF2339 domain-containing protein [Alphaproteobacteria bacterium]|nr:DUF2339 domain-containing protein [Alphaproteobacteria bacterium]
MEIIGLLGLILLFLIPTTIILPWVNRSRFYSLRREVDLLKAKVKALSGERESPQELQPQTIAAKAETEAIQEELPEKYIEARRPEPAIIKPALAPKPKFNFEQQIGARLPVWVGGIALALGAFYLVKYSIDNSLLNPAVRVFMGGTLGCVFLFAARWIREKGNIANGVRIAQSLSGAGIATLYVSIFAATSLYHFLPNLAGLAGMTVVTGIAVNLSLRHGAPIALLGLVAGFITPALLAHNGDIPTPILFLYLYVIFAGLMAVIKQKRWWGLSLPAVIGTFLWVVYWIAESFVPGDTVWVGLFLLAVSGTIVIGSRNDIEENPSFSDVTINKCNILNYLSLAGAIILMGTITAHSGFGFMEWALFGVLALGGIIMAYIKSSIYGFVPWVLMAVNAVMLVAWGGPSINEFGLVLCIFATLYMGCAYLITWKSSEPSRWVGLSAATAIGYYLLAFFKLSKFNPETDLPVRFTDTLSFYENVPFFYTEIFFLWGSIALVLAGLFIHITKKSITFFEEGTSEKDNVLGISSLLVTTFVTLALTIELKYEFLSVAIATQVLATTWVATRVPIVALRQIAMMLAGVFGFLLIPQALLLVQLTAYSLVEIKLPLQTSVPIVDWPLFQLGLPAAMFIGATYFLRRDKDGSFVRVLELASLGLVAVMGYYLNRHAFHAADEVMFKNASFFERNIMTNILFVYGIACLYAGRRFERIAFSWGGAGLCVVALFRVIYFDIIMHNPLWTHQEIRGIFLANELALAFGVPILWAWFANKELSYTNMKKICNYSGLSILLFVFTWLSLNIRFIFHGAYLDVGVTSNAETYAYSVAWLLLGLCLLGLGVWKKDKMIRYASLAIMILTVGKVFLHDASELEGLFRVFSFLGLGLSLLGLSFFYTRFVFTDKTGKLNK